MSAGALPHSGKSMPHPDRAPINDAPLLRGDRRAVTVLFSDLTGYTALNELLDPEDVAMLLARIKTIAIRTIEAHGGSVNQFVGDEVMAIFGLPVAHEDDPRRAVAAAMDMHAAVRDLNQEIDVVLPEPLRLHSGIQTGIVVAEHRDRREGLVSATGDTVNTAARLLSAAPADLIYIGTSTQTAVTPFFRTVFVAELELKGKAATMPVWRVEASTGVRTRFEAVAARGLGPLSGRVEESALWQAALAQAREHAYVMHVVGEPGIGKSRLTHSFCAKAVTAGVQLIRGGCLESGRVVPYSAFATALRMFLGVSPDDPASAVVEAIRSREPAKDQPSHIAVLLHLLSADSAEYPLSVQQSGDRLPSAIAEVLTAWLGGVSKSG